MRTLAWRWAWAVLILVLWASSPSAQEQAAEEGAAQEPAQEASAAASDGTEEAAADEKPAEKPAESPAARFSIAELRALVAEQVAQERELAAERLEAFLAQKADTERQLGAAKAQLAGEEATSQRLEQRYAFNETTLEKNQARLEERLGQLGELFGVVRQVATDTSGNSWASLTSAQLGQRKELLDRLGRSKELPSTKDLEQLWFELQREMTVQGHTARFAADVLTGEGTLSPRSVVRAGPFVAFTGEGYLKWSPAQGRLVELSRQPPPRYLGTVAPFAQNEEGWEILAVDPSQGILLEALTATPSITERVQQGGSVGYVIIGLGLAALLLGLVRWLVVARIGRRVSAQRRRSGAVPDNPLGRVLAAYEQHRELDPEALELRLEDVVTKENSHLTSLLWLVRTVSVVAPLLGLLGTVTGMIQTFQAITLFGTGDPKMMAGGISEALVTTMLGLVTAIPLVLLYETLSNNTRQIMTVLDEQVANLVATRTESLHG